MPYPSGMHHRHAPPYRGGMDTPAATVPPDPVTLIRQLNPDTIRERLAGIERERHALLVLLRAAKAAHPTDRKGAADVAR